MTNRERDGRVPINDRWASGWKGRRGQTLMKRQVRGVNQVFSWKQKEGSTKSTKSPIIGPAGPPFSQSRGHHSHLKHFKSKTPTAFAIRNKLNHTMHKNAVSIGLCRLVKFKYLATHQQYQSNHQFKEKCRVQSKGDFRLNCMETWWDNPQKTTCKVIPSWSSLNCTLTAYDRHVLCTCMQSKRTRVMFV